MSERPKEPINDNVVSSIDSKIAEENRKKSLHENVKIIYGKHKVQLARLGNKKLLTAIILLVVIVGGSIFGMMIRQDSEGDKTASGEKMPEISKHIDYSVSDEDGDGNITQSDEDARLEKLIDGTGYSSFSDADGEIDPIVENELGDQQPSKGYVDDDLGDTSVDGKDSRPYDNIDRWVSEDSQDKDSTPTVKPPTDDSTSAIPDPGQLSGDITTTNLTISSWNTLYSNTSSQVASGGENVGANADIIGFQELLQADRRTAVRDKMLCSTCAFSGYVKDYTTSGSSPASLAIVWKKDLFTLNTAGYYKVSSTQTINPSANSSDNTISAKWITWVKLRDKKTNKMFYVLNTHTVAGIEANGEPIGPDDSRMKNYVNHMDVLTAKISTFEQDDVPIFVTGDFNVNYRYDKTIRYRDFPFRRLGDIGAYSNWHRMEPLSENGVPTSVATHGDSSRLIDYIWMLNRSDSKAVSTSVSPDKFGSDHSPVYFKATISGQTFVDNNEANSSDLSDTSAFTIIALPDTQYQTQNDYRYKKSMMRDTMNWIVNNKDAQRIKHVVSSGDIVAATSYRSSPAAVGTTGNKSKVDGVLSTASKAFSILNTGNVPYITTSGNHDTAQVCYEGINTFRLEECGSDAALRDTSAYNRYFTAEKQGIPKSNLCEPNKSENAFKEFNAGGLKWLLVTMEYWPRVTAFNCAKAAIESHPNHNVILITHGFLTNEDSRGFSTVSNSNPVEFCRKVACKDPVDIRDQMVNKYSNIKIVLSGHRITAGYNDKYGATGNKVASLMTTIHAENDNPIRIINIDPAKGQISTRIRSISQPKAKESLYNKFTVTISGMKFIR